jgi:hypothetical protein
MTWNYLSNKTPDGYECSMCGARGVKLWRQGFAEQDAVKLLCCRCAAVDQRESIAGMDAFGGLLDPSVGWTDCIGALIPAVPTQSCRTYWGRAPVPQNGVDWWRRLLNLPEHKIDDACCPPGRKEGAA